MNIKINGKDYEVNIIYKDNKNMYLRIKDDLTIQVTTPKRMPKNRITNFINNNLEYIAKVITRKETVKEAKKGKFEYLGKLYEINYINKRRIELGSTKVFLGRDVNIDNWYRKQAKEIFTETYDKCFSNFKTRKKKPELKIRKMKSKWGVCNVTNNIITLNLELIKLNPVCLEYVIYHELCHLKHPDHSKKFWAEVEIYVPNYKKIKKMMKSV